MKCTLHHGYSSPAPQQMLTHCYLWTDHECQIIFFCLLIISHQLLLALVLLALPTRGPPQSSSRDSFPRKAIANHWRETANLRPCERCPVGKYWTKYDHQNQTLPNLWGHGQDLFQWHKRHTNRSSEPAWAWNQRSVISLVGCSHHLAPPTCSCKRDKNQNMGKFVSFFFSHRHWVHSWLYRMMRDQGCCIEDLPSIRFIWVMQHSYLDIGSTSRCHTPLTGFH